MIHFNDNKKDKENYARQMLPNINSSGINY